jgi:CheY-like chemotaxis protein
VADDEALVRMFTTHFLVEAGYTVVEASSAAEALRKLDADPSVRVLLTDIELAREVQRRWPAVVIVVTSGRARPCQDELASGAAFLPKPLQQEAVVETIRERLAV